MAPWSVHLNHNMSMFFQKALEAKVLAYPILERLPAIWKWPAIFPRFSRDRAPHRGKIAGMAPKEDPYVKALGELRRGLFNTSKSKSAQPTEEWRCKRWELYIRKRHEKAEPSEMAAH